MRTGELCSPLYTDTATLELTLYMSVNNNMTVKQLKLSVCDLDLHTYIKCDMDGFDPYTYLELPTDLKEVYDQLSPEDTEDFETELLYHMRVGDPVSVVKECVERGEY